MYFHGSWSWYWLLTPVRLHYDIKYFCVKRWNIFCHLAQNWVCGLLSGDTWPRHCRDEEEDVPILLIIKVKTSSDQICWADDRPQWWDSNFQRPIISDQWKNKKCCEESIWNYLYDQKSEIYFIYEKNMKRKIEKITVDDWMKSMLLFSTFFCFCDPKAPQI